MILCVQMLHDIWKSENVQEYFFLVDLQRYCRYLISFITIISRRKQNVKGANRSPIRGDSVNPQALSRCLTLNVVPTKCLNISEALQTNSFLRVRIYGQLSPEFFTSGVVKQGCPLFSFLLNVVIELIM